MDHTMLAVAVGGLLVAIVVGAVGANLITKRRVVTPLAQELQDATHRLQQAQAATEAWAQIAQDAQGAADYWQMLTKDAEAVARDQLAKAQNWEDIAHTLNDKLRWDHNVLKPAAGKARPIYEIYQLADEPTGLVVFHS